MSTTPDLYCVMGNPIAHSQGLADGLGKAPQAAARTEVSTGTTQHHATQVGIGRSALARSQ